MITVLPSYLGMLMPLLQPSVRQKFSESSQSSFTHMTILFASFSDFLGSILTAIGLFYTGSGLYQVLCSSVVVFTAVLCRIFLQKPLSNNQWIAVLLVNFGLALSAGSKSVEGDSSSLLVGSAFIIVGTILVSSAYVVDQKVMDDGEMDGEELCYYTGCYSTILTVLFTIFYTLPRFNELIGSEVERMNGSWSQVLITLLLLILCSYLHNVSYFSILHQIGSVAVGVLQALRAVIVFFTSAILFCSVHGEQCFSTYKGLSAIFVIGGVILFISNPLKSKRTHASIV